MRFAMTEYPNMIESLREIEANAPATTSKAVRAALLEAANALVAMQHERDDCAQRLEAAGALHAGAMDSESRHLEVAKEMRAVIQAVAAELRATGRAQARAA